MPASPGFNRNWLHSALIAVLLLLPSLASAETKTIYTCAVTSGTSPDLINYVRSVLVAALERTAPQYGAYEIQLKSDMERKRIVYELRHDSNQINSAIFPLDAGLNALLLPVRIPVDRGILGLRIMLVRASDESQLAALNPPQDLKTLRIGILPTWVEARIIRNNGLNAVDGASLEGLLKMLRLHRVDAVDRSAIEIGPEFADVSAQYPEIAIDRHLAFYSPLPVYFWFANDEKGKILSERVRIGLDSMVTDHSLDALFHRAFDPILQQLKIEDRQIIHMNNPDIGPADPIGDNRFWYIAANDR